MGRKSTKENKRIVQIKREELGLTREQASEKLGFISADRLEKIENGRVEVHPEEILAMAEAYNCPNICNNYCANECPIGKKYVPEVEEKALSQITLEVINTLANLNKQKARLVEITVDGQITEEEEKDFKMILDELNSMSHSISSMKLWIEEHVK